MNHGTLSINNFNNLFVRNVNVRVDILMKSALPIITKWKLRIIEVNISNIYQLSNLCLYFAKDGNCDVRVGYRYE